METNNKDAKERRESVKSQTVVLRRDGTDTPLDENAVRKEKDPNLANFMGKEAGLPRQIQGQPLHIDIMTSKELVGYEPSADIGHFRFYPKGALIKDLLGNLAEDLALKKLGATKIHTPILYRGEVPDIADQVASFYEKDYKVQLEDRELILRFAGDFGLFSMLKDAQLSEKNLPLRVYEHSPSFRLEQSGACSGLKRLRGFTMPDIHCFCKDLESGMEEFASLHKFYDEFMRNADLPFALGFRTVKDFWNTNKGYLQDRLKDSGKDAVVEVLDEMKHYWNLKNEFNYIDSLGDDVQMSTVQLDISDSERYGLGYIGPDGTKKPMVIVHSTIGSLERLMGAIFEERGKEMKAGKKPAMPYWLSPTQLRFIPVSEKHKEHCHVLAANYESVRADVDDRNETLSKKVRSAEKEWVSAYTVVGDKELESGKYNVKVRGKEFEDKRLNELDKEGITKVLHEAQGEMPFKDSYLDKSVSKHIRFGSSY